MRLTCMGGDDNEQYVTTVPVALVMDGCIIIHKP